MHGPVARALFMRSRQIALMFQKYFMTRCCVYVGATRLCALHKAQILLTYEPHVSLPRRARGSWTIRCMMGAKANGSHLHTTNRPAKHRPAAACRFTYRANCYIDIEPVANLRKRGRVAIPPAMLATIRAWTNSSQLVTYIRFDRLRLQQIAAAGV